MGRLLNPGVGELVDRLTILQLKIRHGAPQPGSGALDHFRDEEAQINMLLNRMRWPSSDHAMVLSMKLQQCNAQLWELEDQLAQYAQQGSGTPDDCGRCANIAVNIWRANRARNTLIHRLNVLAGGAESAREKM